MSTGLIATWENGGSALPPPKNAASLHVTKTTADVWVRSTPAVWEMTGKRSTGQLERAAGPSSDFQPTPVSSLRKRSKGQDRVEPARPTRERRTGRAGDIAELAELMCCSFPMASSARSAASTTREGDRAGGRLRMGGGELRLRVPREPHKERVIAFRLRVGIRGGLAHSADEYTDDQQDEQAER